MRRMIPVALVLLTLASPGCLLERGLGSSPQDCLASTPLQSGAKVIIDPPEAFVGYCMKVARATTVGEPYAFRLIPADGIVYMPLHEAARYFVSVQVETPTDPYCADEAWSAFRYNGTGLIEVQAQVDVVCA